MYKLPYNCQTPGLDQIYFKYFLDKTIGFFVEVGAYNGYDFSNTWGLAEAGWTGICIEPVEQFAEECKNTHAKNKVKVLQKAVGGYQGRIKMHYGGTVTTGSDFQRNTEIWKASYDNRIFEVDMDTLDNILEKEGLSKSIDVVSIDVEGMELAVMQGFDLIKWNPKMVIIEAQELNPIEELRWQAEDLNRLFHNAGYEKIFTGEINNVYVCH